jgi:tripartite-type tricarboxylate transporter receptor subunit TctC
VSYKLLRSLIAGAVFFLQCAVLKADEKADAAYPARRITIFVHATAGGGNDALARLLAQQLQERVGPPVVVENRPGGGGAVGSEYVARSAPDGYTLLLITTGETYYKALNPSVQFDTAKDFSPIALVASIPLVLVSKAQAPFASFSEFVTYAKANPNKLSYGSAGAGTPHHVVQEMLNRRAGLDITHVPYRGTSPAITDLLSGQITVAWSSPIAVKQFIDSGTLKALAVADSKRTAFFPEVPTISESGYPDISFDLWFGIVAPRGLSPSIVAKLNDGLIEAARNPDIQQKLSKLGFEAVLDGPAAFAKRIEVDHQRYTKSVKESGLAK